MNLEAEVKQRIVADHRRTDGDTGSVEVQVALITEKVNQLTEHLKGHRKDHASRRGLRILVGKRSRLLRYLKGSDVSRYQQLIQRLGLRK